jgi:hypothetical protein
MRDGQQQHVAGRELALGQRDVCVCANTRNQVLLHFWIAKAEPAGSRGRPGWQGKKIVNDAHRS